MDKLYRLSLGLWTIALLSVCFEKIRWISAKFDDTEQVAYELIHQLRTEPDCLVLLVVFVLSASVLTYTVLRSRGASHETIHASRLTFPIGLGILSLPFLLVYGGKATSFILSDLGQYAAAERVFVVVRDYRDICAKSSVATYLCCRAAQDATEVSRTNAVVSIYGCDSAEFGRLIIERSIALRKAGRLDKAESCLKAMLNSDASYAQQSYAKALLALYLSEQGKTAEASSFYSQAKTQASLCADQEMAGSNAFTVLLDSSVRLGREYDTRQFMLRSNRIKRLETANSSSMQVIAKLRSSLFGLLLAPSRSKWLSGGGVWLISATSNNPIPATQLPVKPAEKG